MGWLAALCLATLAAGIYRFRRLERRWRWRWQEIPSGRVDSGPACGAYREPASVAVTLPSAPASIRAGAELLLLYPGLLFAVAVVQLDVSDGSPPRMFGGVFYTELCVLGACMALYDRAASALLARRGQGKTRWLLPTLVGVAVAGSLLCAAQVPLTLDLYVTFDAIDHPSAVVWELVLSWFVLCPLPLALAPALTRRYKKELAMPTRYLEWGAGLYETQPAD